MGILLTILKVIGIILAAILGLILLIVIALLFVGFGYRVDCKYGEAIDVKARVTWLWWLVYFGLSFSDKAENKLDFKLRIFCIPIISKARMDKKKNKKLAETEDNSDNSGDPAEANLADVKAEDDSVAHIDEVETDDSTNAEPLAVYENSNNETDASESNVEASVESTKKSTKEKLDSTIESTKEKLDSTKEKVSNVVDKITSTKDRITSIVTDKQNQEFVKKVLSLTVKLLKKLLIPKKHFVYVRFGNEDPGSTGQIAGYVAMAQTVVPLNLVFVPEFEEKTLEVNGYIYGKIRLISIVIPLVKIYFDKRFKRLLRQIKSK